MEEGENSGQYQWRIQEFMYIRWGAGLTSEALAPSGGGEDEGSVASPSRNFFAKQKVKP